MKTIGVLGGMGPYASLDFYRMLIEQSDGRTNDGFPHILLSNLPVPDYIEDRSREEEAVQMVEAEAQVLENAGADFLVITCNTMHLHLPRFQRAVSIPFLSMTELVVEQVARSGVKRVGILGSPTTLETRLYQDPLSDRGIETLIPNIEDQARITKAILSTVGGQSGEADVSNVLRAIDHLSVIGAEAVILGCTELPVLLRGIEASIPIFRSTEILAEASCIDIFTGKGLF